MDMRYLPLDRSNKPLVAYKSNPDMQRFAYGIEGGEWIKQAVDRGYGVGVMLEPSGLAVIDCDSGIEYGPVTKEELGIHQFTAYCTALGHDVPPTYTVATGTPGHYHLYYGQNPEHNIPKTKIRTAIPHCDVKTTGFVVGSDTAGYEVVRSRDVAVLPLWLAEAIYPAAQAHASVYGDRMMTHEHAEYLLESLAMCGTGSRNDFLWKTARDFAGAGMTDPESRNALLHAAVRCGLPDAEAIRTLDSAWNS
jgi:hypothetical protein